MSKGGLGVQQDRRPLVLVVDDEAAVVDALTGDLDLRFGRDYRIEGARSSASALDRLASNASRRTATRWRSCSPTPA